MSVTHVRGYAITESWRFIHQRYDAGLIEALTADSPEPAEAFKATGWYPVERANHVWGVVAATQETDDKAREELIACGQFCANAASTTFMRLLIRVMTPSMLARKLPDIWKHDFRGGTWTNTTLDDQQLTSTLTDVGTIAHVGPIAAGFVTFVMQKMGKHDVHTSMTNWSRATPAPDKLDIHYEWS